MPSTNKIQFRRGTSTAWTSGNPVLESGEPGYDTTNNVLKIGNGSQTWSQLSNHNHTSSNITDFNSGVSGLLPVGTANYLSKFGTGGSGLSNSLVFDNGVSVGIGTATEVNSSTRLHLGGSLFGNGAGTTGILVSNTHSHRFVNGLDHTSLYINPTFLPNLSSFNNIYGLLISPSSSGTNTTTNSYSLYVNATTSVTGTISNNYAAIFMGGNVGIGTSTPSTLLEISKDGGGVDLALVRIANTNATGGTSLNISRTGPQRAAQVIYQSGTTNQFYQGILRDGGSTTNGWSVSAGADLNVTAPAIHVTSGNYVGIGTKSPQVLLHVNGQAYLQSLNLTGGTADRILATDTNKNVVGLNTSTYPTLTELSYVKDATSSIQTQLNTKAPLSSPAFTGTPTAPTASGGTNTTQIATTAFVRTEISSLADAAPGTLDTLNELAAALGDDPNFATTVTNSLASKISATGTANYITKFSGSQTATNSLIYDDGTNVGIGTSSPSYKLDVAGDAEFGSNNWLKLIDTGSNNGRLALSAAGSIDAGGTFMFRNNAGTTEHMRITTGGDVGIGTATPSYKLNVNPASNSNNGIQILNNSAGTSARSLLSLFNGSYGAEISVGGTSFTSNGFYRQNRLLISGPFITDYVTGQHYFHIGGGGTAQAVSGSTQVGFWDINALTVQNELRPTAGIAGGTLVGSSLTLKSTTNVGTTDHIKLVVGNNGATEAVRIINNGNVGIGTTTPTYKLEVNGSFAASTKSFRINHPSKSGWNLEYGSLESPYHGVRLTGRGTVVKGVGVVSLPDYLKDLIHDDDTLNIQITNIKHGKTIYLEEIDLKNDQFIVKVDRAKSLGELQFCWTLTGVRKDVDHLVVEKEN